MPEDEQSLENDHSGPQFAVGVFAEGSDDPVEVLLETAPNGFPADLLHYLAEYMARGFNYAMEGKTLKDWLGKRLRGRPIDERVQREGREAATLHQEKPNLSWGQIATQVCKKRDNDPNHTCDRMCADRINKAAQPYLKH